MNKLLGVSVILALLFGGVAAAEVRDDYRACEQNFLRRLPPGVAPQAATPEEEYCLGLGYWFQSNQNRLPRDPEQAVFWHKKAAEHGVVPAQVTLAYHYEKGYGVKQDLDQATRWYRSAADKGDASAVFNLGRLAALGRGVEKDEAESERLFRLAEERGSVDARVQRRKGTQYDVLEAPAREVFQQGYAAYEARDYARAAALYRQAADAGNVSAKVALGQLIRNGLGVPQDFKAATELYRAAALAGHSRAQAQLGLSYELAQGVSEDWAEAVSWYRKSAAQIDALGLFSMGRIYQFGIGVPQDRQLAVAWFEKAENQGEQQAGFFAKWLRNPKSCLGYLDDAEREKFAGVCSDPKGIGFRNSKERRAWLAETMSRIPVDMFGSSSYQQGACGAIGGNFHSGNCYGSGGGIINPNSQDRYGNNLW